MENYILKLNSGTEYKLYKGTALVSDADLTTLFGAAGEMFLSFDFNSGTPSSLTTLTITNSSDVAVITNTDVTVAEGKNYKATWSASATTFDTFEELEGKALDESQLSFLMEKIKEGKEIRTVTFSSLQLNMWDKTTYPDGIYRVEYTGSGHAVISLSPNGDGIAVQSKSGASSGGSYLLLGTIGNYGYRYIVGISSRAPGAGHISAGLGTIVSLYSTNGSTTVRFFIGNIINNLTSTESAVPLSANQGRILNTRIGDLTTLTTTAKTSAVVAINEVNTLLAGKATGDSNGAATSIADDAVTTNSISNGAVTSDKIDFTTVIDKIYPVGSIYMSVSNTNPSTFIGGTWVAWGTGRVPVGVNASDTEFNTVEKTGGNKTNTYNFAHRHPIADVVTTTNNVSGIGIISNNESYTGSSSGGANPAQLGDKNISTLQPYITCYMYKRTA